MRQVSRSNGAVNGVRKARALAMVAPLVLATMRGEKTNTRRLAAVPPTGHNGGALREVVPSLLANRGDLWDVRYDLDNPRAIRCPFGVPGDLLWLRESARVLNVRANGDDRTVRLRYEADGAESDWLPFPLRLKLPSLGQCIANGVHREGARTLLRVTAVRCERLQAITEEEARAEGVRPFFERFPSIGRDQRLTTGELAAEAPYRAGFAVLWDELGGSATWKGNPWVWAIAYEVVS